MATNLATDPDRGSFLLELLYFAGWEVEVREGETTTRIRARRADVELEAAGESRADAAGLVFARAMRSGGNGSRRSGDTSHSAGRKRPHRSSS